MICISKNVLACIRPFSLLHLKVFVNQFCFTNSNSVNLLLMSIYSYYINEKPIRWWFTFYQHQYFLSPMMRCTVVKVCNNSPPKIVCMCVPSCMRARSLLSLHSMKIKSWEMNKRKKLDMLSFIKDISLKLKDFF